MISIPECPPDSPQTDEHGDRNNPRLPFESLRYDYVTAAGATDADAVLLLGIEVYEPSVLKPLRGEDPGAQKPSLLVNSEKAFQRGRLFRGDSSMASMMATPVPLSAPRLCREM
ncbi:MAG: hypothetical protein MZV49_23770 [Rhodopseudomonas palustris]|nr:hypothetical protein [Rhodopseudomonas palustris]